MVKTSFRTGRIDWPAGSAGVQTRIPVVHTHSSQVYACLLKASSFKGLYHCSTAQLYLITFLMSCILDSISQPAQIVYLQGASNYTWVHYRDGQKLLLSKPLLYFEAALPSFLRVHKTALVNPRYIQDVTAPPRRKMPGNIHLINGITLPVGRRRWHPLLQDISQAVQLSDEGKNNFYTHISTGGPFNQPAVQQRLYVATANEIKAGLVQQLIEDHWPEWGIHFF